MRGGSGSGSGSAGRQGEDGGAEVRADGRRLTRCAKSTRARRPRVAAAAADALNEKHSCAQGPHASAGERASGAALLSPPAIGAPSVEPTSGFARPHAAATAAAPVRGPRWACLFVCVASLSASSRLGCAAAPCSPAGGRRPARRVRHCRRLPAAIASRVLRGRRCTPGSTRRPRVGSASVQRCRRTRASTSS